MIYGLRKFSVQYGFTMEQINAVRETVNGAASVRHNDVDPAAFCRAFNELVATASELPKEFSSWKVYLESRRAKIADVELQEVKKLLMPRAVAKTKNGAAWAFVFSQIDRACNEWPPEHAGRTAVELFTRYTKWREEFRAEAKEKFESAA